MTNKEAAEFIWDVLDGTKSFNEKGGRGLEALELAIKALKNEKTKESELIKVYTKGFDTGVETVKNERPQGKWIFHKDYNESCRYGCNQCGNLNNINSRFCPNCGARMQKDFEPKKEEPFITECRDTAIKENLPLYFVYYEEKGIFEVYETETKELFEKRHCAKHLSNYEFKNIVTIYLDNYSDWKGDAKY